MPLEIPDGLTLYEIFEINPKLSNPQDGFRCYVYTDPSGITLELSFNVIENWIKTVLLIDERITQSSTYEGVERIVDARDYKLADGRKMALRGEFNYRDAQAKLEIFLEPQIMINWAILKE